MSWKKVRVVPEDAWGIVRPSGDVEVWDRLPPPVESGAPFCLWTIELYRVAVFFELRSCPGIASCERLESAFDAAAVVDVNSLRTASVHMICGVGVPVYVLAIAAALTAIDGGDIDASECVSVSCDQDCFEMECEASTDEEVWLVTLHPKGVASA